MRGGPPLYRGNKFQSGGAQGILPPTDPLSVGGKGGYLCRGRQCILTRFVSFSISTTFSTQIDM